MAARAGLCQHNRLESATLQRNFLKLGSGGLSVLLFIKNDRQLITFNRLC